MYSYFTLICFHKQKDSHKSLVIVLFITLKQIPAWLGVGNQDGICLLDESAGVN